MSIKSKASFNKDYSCKLSFKIISKPKKILIPFVKKSNKTFFFKNIFFYILVVRQKCRAHMVLKRGSLGSTIRLSDKEEGEKERERERVRSKLKRQMPYERKKEIIRKIEIENKRGRKRLERYI